MTTSRRRKVSISKLDVSAAANFQRRDLIDEVVQSDFFLITPIIRSSTKNLNSLPVKMISVPKGGNALCLNV